MLDMHCNAANSDGNAPALDPQAVDDERKSSRDPFW